MNLLAPWVWLGQLWLAVFLLLVAGEAVSAIGRGIVALAWRIPGRNRRRPGRL